MRIRLTCSILVLLLAICLDPTAAWGQLYPAKSVRVIVPYPPGGAADPIVRGMTQRLAELWGQAVVVENRAGAGTVIGAELVAKAPGDGYTLLFSDSTTYVISPHLHSRLPYDILRDFAPIAIAVRLSPVVVVHPSIPVGTFRELVAYIKDRPGKLSYASFGNGAYGHVAMEHLKRLAGIDVVHVPYKGGAAALPDLLSGQISMMFGTFKVYEPLEKAGKLKFLATTTARRIPLRPDLPTISESGVPGFSINLWFALAAPSSTPPVILDKINADVRKILREPEYLKFLAAQGLEPIGTSREESADTFRSETAHWAQLVRDSGAKVD